jgi:hypothetical protein
VLYKDKQTPGIIAAWAAIFKKNALARLPAYKATIAAGLRLGNEV